MTSAERTIEHILEPEERIRAYAPGAYAPGPGMLAAGNTLRSYEASARGMTIKEEK